MVNMSNINSQGNSSIIYEAYESCSFPILWKELAMIKPSSFKMKERTPMNRNNVPRKLRLLS